MITGMRNGRFDFLTLSVAVLVDLSSDKVIMRLRQWPRN